MNGLGRVTEGNGATSENEDGGEDEIVVRE